MSQTKLKPSDTFTATKSHTPRKDVREKSFIAYTIHGKHNYTDEQNNPIFGFESKLYDGKWHNDIYATKECDGKGKERYFIRIDAEGKYYDPLDDSKRRELRDKRNIVQVNCATFAYYVNFLQTRNITWLKMAQKEGIDG